jgi:hypothetical protein
MGETMPVLGAISLTEPNIGQLVAPNRMEGGSSFEVVRQFSADTG